ncbi:Mis12-Mtw1 protein family-domain-containing protein [Russula earlei]|uniref:Mis12-Mtw1 protein family-domain-containing protein n=1 Tax=Russula earlei TaxID=71964 RepID=A0ACC0ULH3_9AGAM|nr:Mis12-Mtw1 protein family-domain-containing protein [Russula earlei]
MIPSEANGKRKAAPDDNIPNTNGASKAKRTRKDNVSHKRKLLNGEEQRGGLVIIRDSKSSQPSSDSNNAIAGPSQPPNKKFRAAPAKASGNKHKHKSPDEDGAVDEDVRRMEMEADALRRAAHLSRDLLPRGDTLLPLAPRETPKIEHNRAMRGEGSRTPHTPRSVSMSSRGKRLSNSFDRMGIITQPHPSVDDSSLYKHIDSELPDPDRARQLILLCAARAPLPAPREGKDPPSEPSEEGIKLLQELKEDVLLLLAERKIDMNVTAIDRAGSPENGVDVRPNEQNVNNRARTTRFKDEIRIAKAEDDAWASVAQFYNSYQETVVRELDQRQKAKGKRRARPEEGLRISELPKPLQEASDLALSVLAKDATGKYNAHNHRWSELRHKVEELRALVNTAVQTADVAETDLNRRFTHLSQTLRARTQRAAKSTTSALSTYLPQRPPDPSESRDLFRALARVDAARPPAQVGAEASRAAREVLRAQDAPASERRITPVAPPTPRTPRRPGTPGRVR